MRLMASKRAMVGQRVGKFDAIAGSTTTAPTMTITRRADHRPRPRWRTTTAGDPRPLACAVISEGVTTIAIYATTLCKA